MAPGTFFVRWDIRLRGGGWGRLGRWRWSCWRRVEQLGSVRVINLAVLGEELVKAGVSRWGQRVFVAAALGRIGLGVEAGE
jgi:hypothetical protein